MRIVTLFLSTTLFVANASSINDKDSSIEQQFESWVKDFEREYGTEEEKEKRMKIWMENNGKSITLQGTTL